MQEPVITVDSQSGPALYCADRLVNSAKALLVSQKLNQLQGGSQAATNNNILFCKVNFIYEIFMAGQAIDCKVICVASDEVIKNRIIDLFKEFANEDQLRIKQEIDGTLFFPDFNLAVIVMLAKDKDEQGSLFEQVSCVFYLNWLPLRWANEGFEFSFFLQNANRFSKIVSWPHLVNAYVKDFNVTIDGVSEMEMVLLLGF